MTSTTHCACQAAGRPAASRLDGILQILRRLPLAHRIHRERRALMSFSDRGLKDLGLSRADAYREASRSWWDIPGDR